MQLDKIVAYHKALADPTRLRILLLLSGGELHGQGLAEKLGLSQPTVTHHASKLREAGLLKERRDKNTVYFKLNSEYIRVGGEESLRFIFSGENPHCGEDGLISKTDEKIVQAIEILRKNYSSHEFIGPLSGDTLLANSGTFTKKDCLIFASHDQGLAPYKAISGFRASNVTIGLPFLRLSPDHGTANELYGKDVANYIGAFFTLKESIRILGNNEYR